MKLLKFLLFATLCTTLLAACGDDLPDGPDEPGTYQTFGSKGMVLAVTETDHFTTQLLECNGASVTVNIGVNAEYSLDGFRTDASDVAKVLTVPGLHYKTDGPNLITAGTDIIPRLNGVSSPNHEISDFNTTIYKGKNVESLFVTTIVMGNYIITTPYTTYILSGQTKVSKQTTESQTPYVNENAKYIINIDRKTMTADIEIKGAKFASMMPGMDMTFPGTALTFSGTDGFELSADNLIPIIGKTPYPDYAISDVYFSFKHDASVPSTLRFTMTHPTLGTYNVIATLFY